MSKAKGERIIIPERNKLLVAISFKVARAKGSVLTRNDLVPRTFEAPKKARDNFWKQPDGRLKRLERFIKQEKQRGRHIAARGMYYAWRVPGCPFLLLLLLCASFCFYASLLIRKTVLSPPPATCVNDFRTADEQTALKCRALSPSLLLCRSYSFS